MPPRRRLPPRVINLSLKNTHYKSCWKLTFFVCMDPDAFTIGVFGCVCGRQIKRLVRRNVCVCTAAEVYVQTAVSAYMQVCKAAQESQLGGQKQGKHKRHTEKEWKRNSEGERKLRLCLSPFVSVHWVLDARLPHSRNVQVTTMAVCLHSIPCDVNVAAFCSKTETKVHPFYYASRNFKISSVCSFFFIYLTSLLFI